MHGKQSQYTYWPISQVPNTRFEYGRRYACIKSLEHLKRQNILQIVMSFEFCFILSLDKYALL